MHDGDPHPEDLIDGCEADLTVDPTSDEDVDYVVLFAGVAPEDVEAHAAKLREVLGA